jgi:hypothetical protein
VSALGTALVLVKALLLFLLVSAPVSALGTALVSALVSVECPQRRASHMCGAPYGLQSLHCNNYGQENTANPACSKTSKRHHALHTTRKQRLHRPDILQQSNILDVNGP